MIYYQYFSIESCLIYLSTELLKVSIPNRINDPFEFLPNFVKIEDKEILRQQALKQNIADLLISKFNNDPNFIAKYGIMTINRWPIVVENDMDNIIKFYKDSSSFAIQNHFQDVLNEISLIYGMVCFSSKKDSILMWSHYAKEHSGVVIGFGKFPLWIKIQKVKYSKKRIPVKFGFEIVDINDLKEVFFNKNINWKYEHEYRLGIYLSDCIKNKNDYYIKVPLTTIKAIYFGIKTAENDIVKIQNIVNANIAYFKGKYNYSDYKIDFL